MEGVVNPKPGFWKGRSVLITGHTGFKGSWLAFWLQRLGAKVTGLSLAPDTEPSLFKLIFGEQPGQYADIRDLNAVRWRLTSAKPQIVFHMAAQSLVHPSYRDPVGTYATNVMGTVHLLEAVREMNCIEAAVIVTSDKCYDNKEWPWAYRETEPMGGRDPYSNSKGCAELVTSAYRASFFAPTGGGRGEPLSDRKRAGRQCDRWRRLVQGPPDPGYHARVRVQPAGRDQKAGRDPPLAIRIGAAQRLYPPRRISRIG